MRITAKEGKKSNVCIKTEERLILTKIRSFYMIFAFDKEAEITKRHTIEFWREHISEKGSFLFLCGLWGIFLFRRWSNRETKRSKGRNRKLRRNHRLPRHKIYSPKWWNYHYESTIIDIPNHQRFIKQPSFSNSNSGYQATSEKRED